MEEETARMKFGEAVKTCRKRKSLTQDRLSRKINDQLLKGHSRQLYQEMISRLERGDSALKLAEEEVEAIQKFLELPDDIVAPLLDEIQSTARSETGKGKDTAQIKVCEAGQLISKDTNPEFQPYIGKYHCLFISTDSSSSNLVRGLFEITIGEDDSGQCVAHMTVYDKKGKEIKWYTGPFFINIHYRTWHCILVGEKSRKFACSPQVILIAPFIRTS